jgi:hypothetical protein
MFIMTKPVSLYCKQPVKNRRFIPCPAFPLPAILAQQKV